MTVSQNKHLVIFPAYFWGHARPISTLAARIVKLRPIKVTFFVIASIYDSVRAEIARDFEAGEEEIHARIRLVALKEGTEDYHTSGAPGAFRAAWEKIWAGEPLICAKTGARFEAPPTRPSGIIIDIFAIEAQEIIREISGRAIKMYSWYASATSSFFLVFSAGRRAEAREKAALTGKTLDEAMAEAVSSVSGKLVESPCMPPMYDYEMHPQEMPLSPQIVKRLLCKVARFMDDTEGVITFDAYDYQPRATAALQEYYARDSRRAVYAGPLVPAGEKAVSGEMVQSRDGGATMAFLDKQLKLSGERSVVYISFGSLFWPKNPTRLWAIIEVLIEKNVPFVMSKGAALATPMPEDIKAKIEKYGNAVVSDWVPQQSLLEHPATGWYLTHGGHNSTIESIMAGVPMIVWPIDADQPMNGVYLSEEANVAYELVEIRNGCGLGKIYRNGRVPIGTIDAVKDEMRNVLDQAFGEDGLTKRVRLQTMKKALRAAWGENGVARRDVGALLDDI
ncbi:UDP-Glycosyltransferase/glycogen phosphorylase [Trametes polyzona]|nr:UDP-Glycosyltransferase/glycogen phosphorylase [Trametes polyzona]